jgi:hypothetical protein
MNPTARGVLPFLRFVFQHQWRNALARIAPLVVLSFAMGSLSPAGLDEIGAAEAAAVKHQALTAHNVAIVVESTRPMNVVDSDGQCNSVRFDCMLAGVRALLSQLSPCGGEANCGPARYGKVTNAVDAVSLFTFSNVTVGTVINDYSCSRIDPVAGPYTFPMPGESEYAPPSWPARTPTYRIVDYASDYRTSDTTSELNPDSDLVKAFGGASGCPGMKAVGGESTYLAGAIYAAQASLIAERAARPGSRNVLIVIAAGYANATPRQMGPGATDSGTYPSWVNECRQAVAAARFAAAHGTRVYSVAYGAQSSGCGFDSAAPEQDITPCQTMRGIASSPAYFFSDYTQSFTGSTCVSAAHRDPNLIRIFTEIGKSIEARGPIVPKRPRPPG